MKFPNIDFDAISRMVNMMDDEQIEQIVNAAGSLMEQTRENEEEQEEEIKDAFEFLNLDDELTGKLPGNAISALESASDLEQFYLEDPQADLSASILFLCKALLFTLQKQAGELLRKTGLPEFQIVWAMTLDDYARAFRVFDGNPELAADVEERPDWQNMAALLDQMSLLQKRSEYYVITKEDLESAKQILFAQNLLSSAADLQENRADDEAGQTDNDTDDTEEAGI